MLPLCESDHVGHDVVLANKMTHQPCAGAYAVHYRRGCPNLLEECSHVSCRPTCLVVRRNHMTPGKAPHSMPSVSEFSNQLVTHSMMQVP